MTFGENNAVAQAIGHIIGRLSQLNEMAGPEAIADWLKREGCEGEPGQCDGCPVWQWMTKNMWYYRRAILSVSAGQGCAIIYFTAEAGGGRFVYDMPKKVGQFMRGFDKGEYPGLVREAV